jgi:hypothetical protein
LATKQELLEAFTGGDAFGGPAFVDVVVDNGQEGVRGSAFFLSAGNPNNETSPALLSYPDFFNPGASPFTRVGNPQRYDVCIDVSPISPTYLDLFYYQDGPEGTRWYDQIRLTPEGYPLNTPLDFDELGNAVLDFPSVPAPPILTSIIASQAISSSFNLEIFLAQLELLIGKSLNVQYNLVNENPVASTIYPYGSEPVSVSYGFRANLTAGQSLVTLESGNILDIFVGQEFFKVSGDGVLGDGTVVTSILSATQFTVSEPHDTSGNIIFSSAEFSGTVSTSSGQTKTVNLTSGNTKDLSVGEMLFKSSGDGSLGVNPIVTRILSPTSFTVSSDSLTSGAISFGSNLPNIDLILGISSAEYNSGTWAPLSGEKLLHILVGITPFSI